MCVEEHEIRLDDNEQAEICSPYLSSSLVVVAVSVVEFYAQLVRDGRDADLQPTKTRNS